MRNTQAVSEAVDTRFAQVAHSVETMQQAQAKAESETRDRYQELQTLRQAQAQAASEAHNRVQELYVLGQAQAKTDAEVRHRYEEFQAMRMRILRAERRLRRIDAVENGNATAALAELSTPPLAPPTSITPASRTSCETGKR